MTKKKQQFYLEIEERVHRNEYKIKHKLKII